MPQNFSNHVPGQNRSLEGGSEKYFVPQKISNHVLGQNRSLEEGSENHFAPQKVSNHVLGQDRFPEMGSAKVFGLYTRPGAKFAMLLLKVRPRLGNGTVSPTVPHDSGDSVAAPHETKLIFRTRF